MRDRLLGKGSMSRSRRNPESGPGRADVDRCDDSGGRSSGDFCRYRCDLCQA